MLHSLEWLKKHDQTKANPKVLLYTSKFGASLRNADGLQQSLMFSMCNDRGVMGAAWLTQATCDLAFNTLLYDCLGDDVINTRGGA